MTINSLDHYPEVFYLLTGQFQLLFLIALIAGLSSFFGSYLRKRGENQAIEESFDLIREQL